MTLLILHGKKLSIKILELFFKKKYIFRANLGSQESGVEVRAVSYILPVPKNGNPLPLSIALTRVVHWL
jgi:hypothetical protein